MRPPRPTIRSPDPVAPRPRSSYSYRHESLGEPAFPLCRRGLAMVAVGHRRSCPLVHEGTAA
ncbi:hypothetical protein [Lysobacter gummosus]|uniref:hypothetical protein n=1 Tax=Lysobacter gummosus TaxID=262324 RepID=UPI00362DEC77